MSRCSLQTDLPAGAHIHPSRTRVIQNWPHAIRANLQCGVFGRTMHKSITNLTARIVRPVGNILVSGVDDMVPIPNTEEHALYAKLD
ncbi:hypothetical protein B0H11DRAFT_2219717 [Mycena galericulata]|nr:hypothetical protein B0H11DRAFT_2219717 [Mycena galericulata]